MSESYTIVPLDEQCREWLIRKGHAHVPKDNGRQPTLGELRVALMSIDGLSVEWTPGGANVEDAAGICAQLMCDPSDRDSDPSAFHFLDGSDDLIEVIAVRLASIVGPLVVVSCSGSFTKVAFAP